MDEMVLKTQQWLNSTYRGRTGYTEIPENGNTGWTTIYALLHALQIELGITATADNFGSGTISRFNSRYPNGIVEQLFPSTEESNVYGIIQGALWCKGYSTGASSITKHFYSGTGLAVRTLKGDAGIPNELSTVTLNVMKALMSMDQFKLVSGGTETIRNIQKEMNSGYEAYIGLSPCDGIYSRTMNKSLIKILQAIEGYSVEDATGNFGDGTKSNLPILPNIGNLTLDTERKAIKLLRYALCCNGYEVPITSQEWDSTLSDAMDEFQRDMCIDQLRICDTNTWMALLLSKGNPDRNCVACDTRFEMTNNRLNYLKANGYQIVGRYLTGGDFKELRIGEPQRILNAEIKLFLIFQESGTDLTYFTFERGKIDSKNAVKIARKHAIPGDNVIYFAVDTDPTDPQISAYILPYFKAISENISKSYKVGVYGTRNVCTQIMSLGYAETCFVSDMSTGFSGNMGFKMPPNWNLDQFHEIKNIVISGEIENMDLDKVAYSGRFPVVEDVYQTIIKFNSNIKELEKLYIAYKGNCTARQIILGITNFLRSFKYGTSKWYIATLTDIDDVFIDYVKNNNINLYNNLAEYASTDEKALVDILGGYVDIGHLAATVEGYLDSNLAPDFWFGWGGDLASLMDEVDRKYVRGQKTHLELAKSLLGDRSNFNYPDTCTDADAIRITEILMNATSNTPFSDAIAQYYLSDVELRYSYYLKDLDINLNLNLSNLKSAIMNKMTGVFENIILIPYLGTLPSAESKDACYEAFAQYILDNYPII
ncbi:MAG: DUF1906 domain-containing protein [Clostridia bacterium]|nr:DUF1906 domain-containing protein [Clostridia bacterium]